ncbi:hypothetical protein Cgig2_001488 [Carnegiea gigantea]|uniref:Uncharacterized protein n=1 Tax=Carnegiea gigantea TaxID=171969 RepID=A0A9Q1QPJ8_9CARY|nr:hypothetical protein Cgig2_001488 [Carnegiea gigantea]
MKDSISKREAPPSATEPRMAAPSSAALFLIFSPSFDVISLLTTSSIVFDVTGSGCSASCAQLVTSIPILSASVMKMAFLGCSECIGHAAMGTPTLMLSMHEFQPQKSEAVDHVAMGSGELEFKFYWVPEKGIDLLLKREMRVTSPIIEVDPPD